MSTRFDTINNKYVIIQRGVSRASDIGIRAINTSLVDSISNESLSIASGQNLSTGVLIFERVSKEDADNFKDFIANQVRFYGNTFDITPDQYTDLGNGKGVKINNVKYKGQPTTNDIIKTNSTMAEKYTLTLPYEYNKNTGGFGEL